MELEHLPWVLTEKLLDDPHLSAARGLAEVRLTDGPRTEGGRGGPLGDCFSGRVPHSVLQ